MTMGSGVFFLLLLFQLTFAYTDDSINLLVRSTSSSIHRFCIELAALPNNRSINVTSFGWYQPHLASSAVNACNLTDLQTSFPNSLPNRTMLIVYEHQCKMTEHAWNVEQYFGSEITLMIITKRTNTRYSLTLNSTAMPVTIGTLIFWENDFQKLTSQHKDLSSVQFSIDYPLILTRKFRAATLLIFLLVFLVLLAGNFWAADEFKRLLYEKLITTTNLSSSSASIPIVHQLTTTENVVKKSNSVTPNETSVAVAEEHKEPAVIPMTYCLIVFILFFAVGWLLLIYYFPKVMIYVLQVMFCIGAFSSLTSCLDRLSQFVPAIRRYQLPATILRKPCLCQLGPTNVCTLMAVAVGLTLVLIWYFYRLTDWAWVLQDILGAAICIRVTSIYRLGNMRVITLILLGFFFYDIFFVFITPYIPIFQTSASTSNSTAPPSSGSGAQTPSKSPSVMEQVALGIGTNGEVVPLLFALPMFIPESERDPCQSIRKSMLGFGDVILPGILLTFCKLFDIASGHRWPVYYVQSVISYFVGLALTHVALNLMNTAQPALLYLVPCLLLSTIFTGLCRGELKELYTGRRIKSILDGKAQRSSSSLLHGIDNSQGSQLHDESTFGALEITSSDTR